jgi:hypothetical protein
MELVVSLLLEHIFLLLDPIRNNLVFNLLDLQFFFPSFQPSLIIYNINLHLYL